MIGLGTLVNMACILLGGIGGLLFGRFLTERCRSMAMTACGVSLLFIGGAGTLQKMLIIEDGQLSSYGSIMLALCLTLGSLLGEWLDLERHVERLGQWRQNTPPPQRSKAMRAAPAENIRQQRGYLLRICLCHRFSYGLRGRYGHHRFHQ